LTGRRLTAAALTDCATVVTIELVNGEKVTLQGLTAEQVLAALDNASARFATFETDRGTEHVRPAHVVRIIEQ
jgi:hypothetical protein